MIARVVPESRSHQSSAPGEGDLRLIVERFQGPLRSFFRKRAFDPQETEDLVQEVFTRLAGRSDAPRLENREAYIFQTAANLLRDRARRDISRAAAFREFAENSRGSFEEISPERVLQGKQGLADLQRALLELPERTRAIFVLHRFEELKYSEIARRLGISVSSVEKHMMDALRHVAACAGRG
jgi:RNA polymerase sigma-70 factor (ECF subfamily)